MVEKANEEVGRCGECSDPESGVVLSSYSLEEMMVLLGIEAHLHPPYNENLSKLARRMYPLLGGKKNDSGKQR